MRIAFTTLGCKINQVETDMLRRNLEARGDTIVPFSADADVYVINTCSVTAKSDYQCRQAIRSAVRRKQGAKIVVTGCYAELRPEEIKNIGGVDFVFGARDKDKIFHLFSTLPGIASAEQSRVAPADMIKAVSSRTRGFLKIQDGCDDKCSYCVVPLARGNSRSVPAQEIMAEFERMVRSGCPEIVLTGIHIGTYGMDFDGTMNVVTLLKQLLEKRGKARIRLSSIEPGEITGELLTLLGKGLCRHLHIPLQSGDDTILGLMNRKYSSDFYQKQLDEIAMQTPGIALGADVMVGFPGEGKLEFQNTMRLIEQSSLTHLHVFSYSPRPGTAAATMERQVPESIKKVRSNELRRIAEEKNLFFRRKHVGTEAAAVVEAKKDKSGLLTGLTDNYIRVSIYDAKKEHIGRIVKVKITAVEERENYASIL